MKENEAMEREVVWEEYCRKRIRTKTMERIRKGLEGLKTTPFIQHTEGKMNKKLLKSPNRMKVMILMRLRSGCSDMAASRTRRDNGGEEKPDCQLCDHEKEDATHFLFACPEYKKLRDKVIKQTGMEGKSAAKTMSKLRGFGCSDEELKHVLNYVT